VMSSCGVRDAADNSAHLNRVTAVSWLQATLGYLLGSCRGSADGGRDSRVKSGIDREPDPCQHSSEQTGADTSPVVEIVEPGVLVPETCEHKGQGRQDAAKKQAIEFKRRCSPEHGNQND